MPTLTKKFLTVYWQLWSNKLPTALHNGVQCPFRSIPEAREWAYSKGYDGIRLIPTAVPN